MPSDYVQICSENIEEYGRGTDHLAFLGRLYSDRTHFIFELLQNAEDADASFVRFTMSPSALHFEHNGRVFDEADVRGLCGVSKSTKPENLTKIGKFGIGFKAVYAYTTKPEVHSGSESFEIVSYVRPQGIGFAPPAGDATTLFRFPLGTPQVSAEQACQEILAGLSKLRSSTLLFLRTIQEISWADHRGGGGSLSRVTESRSIGKLVVLRKVESREAEVENWWLLTSDALERLVRVQLAFRLDANGERVCRSGSYPFVVTFPTEKETSLGFLLNGPYQTTPARDNIPRDSAWNKYLLAETGEFLVGLVRRLAKRGELGVDFLEALVPLDGRALPQEHICAPLLQRLSVMLKEDPVLPGHHGGYQAATTLWMGSKAFREFLDTENLAALLEVEGEAGWLTGDVQSVRTPGLYKFLKQITKVRELSESRFCSGITSFFMASRSDAWLSSFYSFLLKHRSLWKRARDSFETDGRLLRQPFLRLTDRTHVRPFRTDGTPRAYLPTESFSQLPMVSAEVMESPQAVQFLKSLGLTEADLMAETLEIIIPKYESIKVREALSTDEHRANIQTILEALRSSNDPRWEAVVGRLVRTSFLKARSTKSDVSDYRTPTSVYVRTPDLENYFLVAGADVWFLENEYLPDGEVPELLIRELAVADAPRFQERKTKLSEKRKRELRAGESFTEELRSTDFHLEGFRGMLAVACLTPSYQRACKYVWNFFASRLSTDDGLPERSGTYAWKYRKEYSVVFPAQWLTQAQKAEWLPKTGSPKLHEAAALGLEDLPPGFERSQELGSLLGFQGDEFGEFAQKHGIETDLLKLLKDPKAKDALRKFAREATSGASTSKRPAPTQIRPGDYGAHLEATLNRPGVSPSSEESWTTGNVAQPVRRRVAVQRELQESWDGEPAPASRVKNVSRRHWEARNPEVRDFLLIQYGGRCQICGYSFPKHNGFPYFEAVWLTPVTHGQWLDQPGNALCLCANCAAKFLHGERTFKQLSDTVRAWRALKEGGTSAPSVSLELCGESCSINYTEKHFLSLQELVLFTPDATETEDPLASVLIKTHETSSAKVSVLSASEAEGV